MRKGIKFTAVLAAAALLFSASGLARADDRYHRRGMSTTEKVITGLAVAAAAGLTAYALAKGHDRGYYHRQNYFQPRSYVAFSFGFRPYYVGHPRGQHYVGQPRGYWYNFRGHRFWRRPYVYNHRYDQAYNSGWERGYWAGYLQGQHEARMRARYYDRFSWHERHIWGYSPGVGQYERYRSAFHAAFGIGYRHGFYGTSYGADNFGFGVHFSYYR